MGKRRNSRPEAGARRPRATRQEPAEHPALDWSKFNFLENLLVFCVLPGRSVPAESGVCFQIASQVKEDGVCLLFHIDRGDACVLGKGIRPDYMVMHATGDECICTIVEMKGKDEKKGEHGIAQLKALRDRLRDEIREHLPGACNKVRFQGILLTPYNAQVPLQEIMKEHKAGFTVLPLQYSERAELYRYVRTLNKLTDGGKSTRYVHEKMPRVKPELNAIEDLLARGARKVRIPDAFYGQRGRPRAPKGRTGLYVNYARPGGDADEYAALAADNERVVIACRRSKVGSTSFRQEIEDSLAQLGLRYRNLSIIDIPDPASSATG